MFTSKSGHFFDSEGKRRTRLVARAAFRRKLFGVLMDPLAPSVLPVFISWVGFWLSPRAPSSRAILAAICLVLLGFQQASHSESRAQDCQLRSIDIWYLTCHGFVLGTLLEFGFIRYAVSIQCWKSLGDVHVKEVYECYRPTLFISNIKAAIKAGTTCFR